MRQHSTLAALLLVPLATTLAAPANAQCPSNLIAQEARLLSATPGGSDLFGAHVDIDGNTCAVGAYADDPPPLGDAGSVRVFTRSGGGWGQQAYLTASNAAWYDYFGYGVALDGDVLAVGAQGIDTYGSASGAAYVFERSGTTWTETQILSDLGGATGDLFGLCVAVSGDTIVVGSPRDDEGYTDSGSAFVFVRSGTNWVQQAQLLPYDGAQGWREFGWQVAIDGSTIAVAAHVDNVGGNANQGSVYVFERNGTTWSALPKLTSPGGAANDQFGESVAISGGMIAAGLPNHDGTGGTDQGAILLFSDQYGPWAFEAQLLATGAAPYDHLGNGVAIEGNLVLGGAPLSDIAGTDSGQAYLFRLCGGVWQQVATSAAWDGGAGDEFGAGVALSGDTALLGAHKWDGTAGDEGAAYVWRISEGDFAVYGCGDGSGTPCPCVNNSLPGMCQGCVNSTGVGAALTAWGSDSASADDLHFLSGNLLPTAAALLFVANNAVNGGNGNPFGDGLRVAGGGLRRLGVKIPTSEGFTNWGPGLGAAGGWIAGDLQRFQVWYRDPITANSPCAPNGAGWNLSNGLEVTFGP